MKNMDYLFILIKFIFYFIFNLDTPRLFKNNDYGYYTLRGGGEEKSEADDLEKEAANDLTENEEQEKSFLGEYEWLDKLWSEAVSFFWDAWRVVSTFFMNWIIIPILMGSVYPAVPFVGVMAVLAAIMKYLLYFVRKL